MGCVMKSLKFILTMLLFLFLFNSFLTAETIITDQGFLKVYDEEKQVSKKPTIRTNLKKPEYLLCKDIANRDFCLRLVPDSEKYKRPVFYKFDRDTYNKKVFQKAFGYNHEFPNWNREATMKFYHFDGEIFVVTDSLWYDKCK